MDLSRDDTVYIVSPVNGEFRPHMQVHGAEKRCKVVWWNLERPDADGQPPISVVADDLLRYVDAIWVSDRHYATIDPRQRFVVLGSHTDIGNTPIEPTYDFTHQSYVWGRREPVIGALRSSLREGPNAWGAERSRILRASLVMVNVHQTPAPVGEPLRFALAAAHRLPVISETLRDPHPLRDGVDVLTAPIEGLYDLVTATVRDPARRDVIGESLYKTLCEEWTFRRGVEHGIAETFGEV